MRDMLMPDEQPMDGQRVISEAHVASQRVQKHRQVTTSGIAPDFESGEVASRRGRRLLAGGILAVVIAIGLGVACFCGLMDRGPSFGDEKTLAKVYQKNRQAVGVVVYTFENKFGAKIPIPSGTAFAVSKTKFITNAHVAYGIKNAIEEDFFKTIVGNRLAREAQEANVTFERYCDEIGMQQIEEKAARIRSALREEGWRIRDVEVRLSSSHGRSLRVTSVQVHPRYSAVSNEDRNSEFDVAALLVEGEAPDVFPVADNEYLYNLTPGMRIGSAGFPMEGLGDNGDIDVNNPEATYASGTIKKLTNFQKVDAGREDNRSITHTIPGAGGASGSPMFTADGKVVGVLWGVAMTLDGLGRRQPSGVLHNWAVRIDQIQQLGAPIPCSQWINSL